MSLNLEELEREMEEFLSTISDEEAKSWFAQRRRNIWRRKPKNSCKHKNVWKAYNSRADASFKYFLSCRDCGEDIGKITWRDEIKITLPDLSEDDIVITKMLLW